MEALIGFAGVLAGIAIFVGVPLSILRSLDEIKAGQRRLEERLAAIERALELDDSLR